MSDSDIYRTTGPGAVSRRGFLKLGAAGTAGAVGLGGAGPHVPSATQDAEAIAPVVLIGGAALAVGAGVNIGWALGTYDPLGWSEPSDGLSAAGLIDSIHQTLKTRISENRSTFVDNRNIIDTGIRHEAFGDGKVACIEEINNESDQATVETAGTDDVSALETTLKKNLLKTWNQSVREFVNQAQATEAHADISMDNSPIGFNRPDGGYLGPINANNDPLETATVTHTMPDGSDFDIVQWVVRDSDDGSVNLKYDPVNGKSDSGYNGQYEAVFRPSELPDYDGSEYENLTLLRPADWEGLYGDLDTVFTEVKDNLLLWVDNVYSEVQAGELNTEDLLTSRELANMSADEEDFNQAIADLMALNISTNLEREATIELDGGNVSLKGRLATTGDTTISTGTVDPSADEFSYYFTYDISQGEGTWTDYSEGVDGGTVTFTSQPYESTEYQIHTTASETATVTTSDFSETDAGGEWTADVSGQLDNPITNIESVNFYADTSETQFETVQLTDTFEVVTFTDTETGEEYDETEHTSNEAHDDTNYITQEEWDAMAERQEKLIEEYNEDSSNGGAGGILPDDLGGSTGMLLLVLAGGAAVLGLQGDN